MVDFNKCSYNQFATSSKPRYTLNLVLKHLLFYTILNSLTFVKVDCLKDTVFLLMYVKLRTS